jgi:undecaprenyl-diphosphatase
VIGFLFIKQIEGLLGDPFIVPITMIVGGIAILAVEWFAKAGTIVGVYDIPAVRAAGIGIAQCVSMIPGFSRSAATIMGALALGVERRTAAEFSFFLAIPTMVGATALEFVKHRHEIMAGASGVGLSTVAVGFVVSFVVAIVVVRAFVHFISRHSFAPFAWYRLVVGAGALVWLMMR